MQAEELRGSSRNQTNQDGKWRVLRPQFIVQRKRGFCASKPEADIVLEPDSVLPVTRARFCDILNLMADRRFSDVGGTAGGLGDFLLGFALTCIGGFLLTNQVVVAGSYWTFWGGNTFGITLIPMLIGVGFLFRDGRSVAGWVLTIAGALFILAGVLANLHIYFQPTSLFNTIVMLVLLVGGLGLIARAMLPHSKS